MITLIVCGVIFTAAYIGGAKVVLNDDWFLGRTVKTKTAKVAVAIFWPAIWVFGIIRNFPAWINGQMVVSEKMAEEFFTRRK